jgi:hypothetical protein
MTMELQVDLHAAYVDRSPAGILHPPDQAEGGVFTG